MRATTSRGKSWTLAWIGLGAWALIGCGRSSHDAGPPAGGHAGREPVAGAGGSTSPPMGAGGADGGDDSGGNEAGGVATGGTAGKGGSGGDGTAGSAVAGAGLAGMAGSSAGQSGLAGAPAGEPGIVCGASDQTLPDVMCTAEEVCVFCFDDETSGEVHCAPRPSTRPADYDAFLPFCMNPILLTECDGPEDCPDGTLCQLRADDAYNYAACSPEPPSCDAYCVACNSSADCADEQSCVPNELGVGSWQGSTCGAPLNELLTAGNWLIGWSGGLNHYSWFRFTHGDTSPDQGTVRTVPATCVACEALSCQGDEGTYEVVGDEVHLAFPDACSPSFRMSNLASPGESLQGGGGSEALASAQVFIGVEVLPAYQALLYAPGVGCDVEFTTCTFPPP